MNVVGMYEFIEGVGGAVFFIEGHEGGDQADENFSTGEDAITSFRDQLFVVDFGPSTDLDSPIVIEEDAGGEQIGVDDPLQLAVGGTHQRINNLTEQSPGSLL